MRRALVAAAVGVVMAVVVSGSATALGPLAGVSWRDLTPDGVDGYVVGSTSTSLRVSAPPDNVGSNLRRVYWPTGAPWRRSGLVCATWASWSPDSVQPGLALRVTGGRAVTVTRNVWAGAYWVLNVHTWLGQQFTQVGQIDLGRLVLGPAGLRPPPWRVCAQVQGRLLSAKVWFPPEVEPAWSSDRVWYTQLPEVWAGAFGWYAGHLPAGGSLRMTDVAVSG